MPKLNKRMVDRAQARDKDYFLFDGELPGFGLRVTPAGVKSYMIQYRANGRTRRVTFGRHGVIGPQKARVEATKLLAAIRDGQNPAEVLRWERGAPTVADACERFMTEHVERHCKPSTQYEYRRSVDLFIKPVIGTMKVHAVTRSEISKLHHDLGKIPYQANRTLGVLSKLFNLTEIWGLRPDGSNPCRHVKRYKEEKRERFLTTEEIHRLGKVLDKTETELPSAVAAIRLLILTGCRLGEIQTLKWNFVDLDDGRLNLPDSKTGGKTIYLGQAAVDVLKAVERDPDNPYVIVGRKPGSHLTDLQRPWRRLRDRAELHNVRIHDLRHTFASSAIGLGQGLPMIGKLLGHSQIQTTARYAHLAADPVRAAAEQISQTIGAALVNGQASADLRRNRPSAVPAADPLVSQPPG